MPGADDLRVERAGQAAVAGDEQQADGLLGLVLAAGSAGSGRSAGRLGRLARHPPDRARVRAQRGDALLGAAQARGGDHLHRARDLLDVLDRRDAVLDVALRPWAGSAAAARRLGRGLLVLGGVARRPSSSRRPLVGARRRAVAGVDQRLALLVEVVAEVVGELATTSSQRRPASRRTSRRRAIFSSVCAASARTRWIRPSRNSATRSTLIAVQVAVGGRVDLRRPGPRPASARARPG